MNHTNTDSTGIRRSLCSGFFEQIYRHPIFSAALVSLIGLVLSTGGVTLSNLLFISVGILALGFAAAFFARRFYGGEKGNLHMALIIASSVITAVLFAFASYTTGESSAAFAPVLMNGGLAVCAAVFFYLLAGNRLSARNIVLLLFAAGFIMRLSYILMMSAVMIQHDVHSLGAGAGHAGYIEYLYANGHLPDFDLREIDQFYHPPIHHILAALWMRLQTMIGIRYADAYENVQVLTLFYSTLSMILSYKIFRRLKLSGSGLIAATAVIAFCPTFYIMSGSVNNDILSVTFMLGAVLNTLNWYQSRSMKHIVYIALCVGFGMITKLSVWMVAPAIGFVFIYVFFTNLKDLKKYLLQYAVFIIICAPIGLFWAVRGFLRWQIPFTYVPRLSETSSQFVGNVPLLQRFFDFSPYQYADVAPQFTMYGGSYNEFNPLIGFFKTSLFDEGIAVRRFPQLVGFSQVQAVDGVRIVQIAAPQSAAGQTVDCTPLHKGADVAAGRISRAVGIPQSDQLVAIGGLDILEISRHVSPGLHTVSQTGFMSPVQTIGETMVGPLGIVVFRNEEDVAVIGADIPVLLRNGCPGHRSILGKHILRQFEEAAALGVGPCIQPVGGRTDQVDGAVHGSDSQVVVGQIIGPGDPDDVELSIDPVGQDLVEFSQHFSVCARGGGIAGGHVIDHNMLGGVNVGPLLGPDIFRIFHRNFFCESCGADAQDHHSGHEKS